MVRLAMNENDTVRAILCDHKDCHATDIRIYPGGHVLCDNHKNDATKKGKP